MCARAPKAIQCSHGSSLCTPRSRHARRDAGMSQPPWGHFRSAPKQVRQKPSVDRRAGRRVEVATELRLLRTVRNSVRERRLSQGGVRAGAWRPQRTFLANFPNRSPCSRVDHVADALPSKQLQPLRRSMGVEILEPPNDGCTVGKRRRGHVRRSSTRSLAVACRGSPPQRKY
jgi:hypothetical protein